MIQKQQAWCIAASKAVTPFWGVIIFQGYVMMSTDCKRWKFKDSVQVLTYTGHIIIQYRKAIKLAHTSEIKEAVERLITEL